MFGLITLDGTTFTIVKEEITKDGKLPEVCPFEIYGFIYKQQAQDKVMLSIVTRSQEVEAEQQSLIEKAMKIEPIFRTKI